jgi:hypothetical protein
MSHYKFLVMQSNDVNNVGFLTETMGGSHRSANVNTNVTHFDNHWDNRRYWNDSGDLLVGFSRWYFRTEEKTSYNMGNRLYSATNTYRFFRVDEDLDLPEIDQIDIANKDLKSFEITEAEFIKNMFESWEFKQVERLFSGNPNVKMRQNPLPVQVDIVYNKETNTWCWSSDYLKPKEGEDQSHLHKNSMKVTIGLSYDDAVKYISARANCEYRFGANDAYNKRKDLERKLLEEAQ